MSLKEYDKQWCMAVHTDLMKWILTQPFRNPVDPERNHAKNYYEIVKNPMDLTKMKRKLTENKYKTLQQFIDDIYLICDNAILFNGENSMFAYIAEDIRTWIDERYANKASSQEEEWQARLDKVVTKLEEHIANGPPSATN